jgi:glycerophosphoryl diester phosphodiesterase
VALLVVLVYVVNASWLARSARPRPRLLAHRGVHQTFVCKELRKDTCTAGCIRAPTNDYLENTLRSMRAAFQLGADTVELDVHATTDGKLAVFHDERLECRTNGSGETDEHTMGYLRGLDIGWGYTSDGGKSYPFRGHGVGLMPTLRQVLDAFPDQRFLIHIKSNRPADAELIARTLAERPAEQRKRLMAYGGKRAVQRLLALMPDMRGLTRAGVKSCVARYEAVGWTGYIPAACRHTLLILPKNYARWLWGWPHRFVARMRSVGTDVVLVGANSGSDWISGIDSVEDFQALPDGYDAGVWTNRIEVVGPLLPRGGG